MARCRCADGACGCAVAAGPGTTVTGTGTPKDPWVISAGDRGYLGIADTATLDLQLLGDGTAANPYVLSGTAVGGGTAVDEVWVGPDDPIALVPSIELWFDPDAVSGLPRDALHLLNEALDRITALETQLAEMRGAGP